MPRLRQGRRATIIVALAAILSMPALVSASDLFSDVPNTSPYHGSIGAIARAGITTGCGDGSYCPAANVSREQMAAFMHRGFGRVGDDYSYTNDFGTEPTTLASLSITPGLPSTAVSGAANFALITGTASLYVSTPSGCPCYYRAWLSQDGNQVSPNQYVTVAEGASQIVNVSVTTVAPLTTSGGHAVALMVYQYLGSSTTDGYASLTAITAPFGSSGGNVESLSESAETVAPGQESR